MATRRGARQLLQQLRAYSTERDAARANENVVPISNAHRTPDSVMQVRSCLAFARWWWAQSRFFLGVRVHNLPSSARTYKRRTSDEKPRHAN